MTTPTPKLRLFLAICAAIFLFNLLTMNDLHTFWEGAESSFVWRVLHPEEGFYLPTAVVGAFAGAANPSFGVRLPGALLLVATFVGVFFVGRRLFGDLPVLMALLVGGASFLLPLLAKLATADIWVLAAHWMGYWAMLRFLKQPSWGWRLLHYAMVVLGWAVAPLATALFFGVSGSVLYWRHPQRGRVLALFPWVALLGALAHGWVPATDMQVLGWHWRTLAYTGLGLAPFIGFCLAGLPDVYRKFSRREELATLLVAWLLGGLVSGTAMLAAALAFMAAKQMTAYFDPKYPFRPWVQAGAVLHLIAAFCVATLVMVNGFYEFRGIGFRSGLVVAFLYWICSLMGVVGLYGLQRRQTIVGPAMAGLLATTVFWVQLTPLLEIQRSAPKVAATEAAQQAEAKKLPLVCLADGPAIPTAAVYAHLATDGRASLSPTLPGTPALVLTSQTPPDTTGVATIEGWTGYFRPARWYVYPHGQ